MRGSTLENPEATPLEKMLYPRFTTLGFMHVVKPFFEPLPGKHSNKLCVPVRTDFQMSDAHWALIEEAAGKFNIIRVWRHDKNDEGFFIIFPPDYSHKAKGAELVTSFLLDLAKRIDKWVAAQPVKKKPSAPNSPYDNRAIRDNRRDDDMVTYRSPVHGGRYRVK